MGEGVLQLTRPQAMEEGADPPPTPPSKGVLGEGALPQVRRKVVWKKVTYYLDPVTQDVFIDEVGGSSVGKKDDKKIVLWAA